MFPKLSQGKGCVVGLCPTLSALLKISFVANVKTVFFYLWAPTGPMRNHQGLYIIMTILYGLWTFQNKATFHIGTKSPQTVVQYINQDITTRLQVDFSRYSTDHFTKLWCHLKHCVIDNSKLVIHLSSTSVS